MSTDVKCRNTIVAQPDNSLDHRANILTFDVEGKFVSPTRPVLIEIVDRVAPRVGRRERCAQFDYLVAEVNCRGEKTLG